MCVGVCVRELVGGMYVSVWVYGVWGWVYVVYVWASERQIS